MVEQRRAARGMAEPRQIVAWGWLAVGVLTVLIGFNRQRPVAQPAPAAVEIAPPVPALNTDGPGATAAPAPARAATPGTPVPAAGTSATERARLRPVGSDSATDNVVTSASAPPADSGPSEAPSPPGRVGFGGALGSAGSSPPPGANDQRP